MTVAKVLQYEKLLAVYFTSIYLELSLQATSLTAAVLLVNKLVVNIHVLLMPGKYFILKKEFQLSCVLFKNTKSSIYGLHYFIVQSDL